MAIIDNEECIPFDTEVKDVKDLLDSVLKDHSGILRPLEELKLSKLGPLTTSEEDDQGILKEFSRVGKIIHKKIESIRDKGYSITLKHKERETSRYGNNKEKTILIKREPYLLKY